MSSSARSSTRISAAAFAAVWLACSGAACVAHGQERAVPAPVFAQGDSWVFDETAEKGATGFGERRMDEVIERLDGPTMVVGIKRDGAPIAYEDHVVGQDWSRRMLVAGEQRVTTRPLNFPLRPGKSWTIDYVDNMRRSNQLSNHVHRTYTVSGWEDVTVPAGTFHAIKVEARGTDEGIIEVPTTAMGGAAVESEGGASFTATHRGGRRALNRTIYGAFYYVPALRTWAKSIEEQYNEDGTRVMRQTVQLVSFKLAG